MGEPAVAAPDGKVPAADGQIVGTGDMAVPAFSSLFELPEIVTTDLCERSFHNHVLDPGYKNPGSTAVVTGYLRFVWHGFDDLVSIFFTMIAVRAVSREDESVIHER